MKGLRMSMQQESWIKLTGLCLVVIAAMIGFVSTVRVLDSRVTRAEHGLAHCSAEMTEQRMIINHNHLDLSKQLASMSANQQLILAKLNKMNGGGQ